jgi:hypothetical protein
MKTVAILLMIICVGYASFAQDMDTKARNQADTTNFSPNKADGWTIYNSFLKQVSSDSVLIEVIVRHNRNINWMQYQYIGYIKNSAFVPIQQQEIKFYLLNDRYKLKIDYNGRCYICLDSGQLPPRDPVIIPFRALYRRS